MPRTRPHTAGRQAQKTHQTRERLVASTLALIRDQGYAAATAQNIARRAGVTWGAAQHQFGSKERILDAILELAYARFIAVMSDPRLRHGSAALRARLLVGLMWEHYQGDLYRVSLEILRARRGRTARAWEQRQGRAHLRVVRGVFRDCRASETRLREALTFTHCCLAGLALERLFERRVRHVDRHLERIAQALTQMLARAA